MIAPLDHIELGWLTLHGATKRYRLGDTTIRRAARLGQIVHRFRGNRLEVFSDSMALFMERHHCHHWKRKAKGI